MVVIATERRIKTSIACLYSSSSCVSSPCHCSCSKAEDILHLPSFHFFCLLQSDWLDLKKFQAAKIWLKLPKTDKKKREPMEGREQHSPPSRLLLQQVEKHNRTHNSFVCLWLSRCGLFLWLQTDGLWFSFQKKKRKKNLTWRLSPFTDIVCGGCSICPPSVVSRLQKKKKKRKKDVSDNTRKEFSKSREKQKNCNRVKTNATSCIVNVSVHFQMIRFTPPSVQEQHLSQVLQWNEERPSLFVQNNKYWNGKWKNGMHTNYNCPTAHIHNALNYHLICYFLLVRSKNINFLHQNRIKINSIRAVFSK